MDTILGRPQPARGGHGRAVSAPDRERSMNARQSNVVGWWRGLVVAGVCMLPVTQMALAQGGSDDQYEVTVKMEMAGMAMPPMSQRLCVKKGASDTDFVPRQENCRVSDTTRTGSRMTFKITCTGSNPMTGTG